MKEHDPGLDRGPGSTESRNVSITRQEFGRASQAKQRLLQKHLAAALRHPDSFTAVVGVVQNELLRTSIQYAAILQNSMSGTDASLATLEVLQPFLDTHLRLHRQITRNADLELRARAQAEKRDFDTHERAPGDKFERLGTSTSAPANRPAEEPETVAGQALSSHEQDSRSQVEEARSGEPPTGPTGSPVPIHPVL